jgi:hypothetical protein
LPGKILLELISVDLDLPFHLLQAAVLLNIAVDLLDLTLGCALARQPGLSLGCQGHSNAEANRSCYKKTHGDIPFGAYHPHMAMTASSNNACEVSAGPRRRARGIYRLDAVRLLIHGRADESP